MRELIAKIPILTTLFSIYFFVIIFRHWQRKKNSTYLLWWTVGVFCYGAGTLTESLTSLVGWNPFVFKAWYITGALLGGAPLAQGTVYLLMKKKTANILTVVLVSFITIAAIFVLLSPVNYSLVEEHRLTGEVLAWQRVRLFSPFINTYAFIFLVGGAIYSAIKYYRSNFSSARVWGNVLIAAGALLPGIGGSFTRFGYTEVLYVTELIGLILIFVGYQVIKNDRSQTVHTRQQASSTG